MMRINKILPYTLVIIITVVVLRFVDFLTNTEDTSGDKKEILEKIENWRVKFIEAERSRRVLQKENTILKTEIDKYETKSDTIIAVIRDANERRDFARLDSLGNNLIGRLRKRR